MSIKISESIQDDNIYKLNQEQSGSNKLSLEDKSIFEIAGFTNSHSNPYFDNRGNGYRDGDFIYSTIDTIPNGHSRYEYNGAAFDIYKIDDDYQSQFVHPDDVSREDFEREFPYLEPIIQPDSGNSSDSNKTVAGVNGKIDEDVIQGSTGDCWLISALYSMCNSEKGQEIIKDAIKVNDDNTVTVSFKGIGVSYTLTPEEISQFDTDGNTSDAYSNGDNDVLAMELAVQKLWKDIGNGRVTLNTSNSDLLYTGDGEGIANGGLPSQLLYYLTGVEPNQIYNKDLSNLSKNQVYGELQKAYQSGNYSLTFGLYGNGHKAKLTNGENFELDLGNGGHALAITDVQKDTVTFVNPWDTSKKYTMTWEEFSKLGVGYMSSSDLTKTKANGTVRDMTDSSNYISKNDYSSRGSYSRNGKRKGSSNNSYINDLIDYFNELINNMIGYKGKKLNKKGKKKA